MTRSVRRNFSVDKVRKVRINLFSDLMRMTSSVRFFWLVGLGIDCSCRDGGTCGVWI